MRTIKKLLIKEIKRFKPDKWQIVPVPGWDAYYVEIGEGMKTLSLWVDGVKLETEGWRKAMDGMKSPSK